MALRLQKILYSRYLNIDLDYYFVFFIYRDHSIRISARHMKLILNLKTILGAIDSLLP